MANTFTLIASYTIPSATTAYTFSSIPGTYTDLVLYASVRESRTGQNWNGINLTLNGTGKTAVRNLYGTGSATSSTSTDNYEAGGGTTDSATANTFSNNSIYIPNYTSSVNKSISVDSVTETNATAALATLTTSTYAVTTAVTSITLTAEGGYNLNAGSTFYLYGVKNA